jgi:hypothetical protein
VKPIDVEKLLALAKDVIDAEVAFAEADTIGNEDPSALDVETMRRIESDRSVAWMNFRFSMGPQKTVDLLEEIIRLRARVEVLERGDTSALEPLIERVESWKSLDINGAGPFWRHELREAVRALPGQQAQAEIVEIGENEEQSETGAQRLSGPR